MPEGPIGSQQACPVGSSPDLKVRVQMIQWDAEKKKLTAMENHLKALRSEDAKTEDALEDITKTLGL